MSKINRKVLTVKIILVVLLQAVLIIVPTARAVSNVIQNPSFESTNAWSARYSFFMGTYAKVQDSTYKHSGRYSGLTQTTNPKQEYVSASLYQSLRSVLVQNIGTLYYWIRKGSSAANGYNTGEVCIYISGGYTLSYYHGFDGSSPPPDYPKYKHINVGNTATNTWRKITRNLCNDLVAKFGTPIKSRSVVGMELFSNGRKDFGTGEIYGQRINWDDLYLEEATITYYTISLTSSTPYGETNLGTITFDGVTYDLPNSIQKPAGSYFLTYNPPSGFSFDYWGTTGGVLVADHYAQTTTAMIAGSGTLEAHVREPQMLYVDDDGPADFHTIQEAIDFASDFYIIRVFAGTYNEDLIVNKPLRLLGENRENTIIYGSGNANTVLILSNYSVLSGFYVRNGGKPGMGGVKISASHNIVEDCQVSQNRDDGIWVVGFNNTVTSSIVTDNLGSHIVLWGSGNNIIMNNLLERSTGGFGVYSWYSSNNVLSNNIVESNLDGIILSYSPGNLIINNAIEESHDIIEGEPCGVGINMWDSNGNTVYHNNFVNNDIHVYSWDSVNVWDNGYPSGGNFWDDYTGSDSDGDGIGDMPYIIDENNRDNYPLMNPW